MDFCPDAGAGRVIATKRLGQILLGEDRRLFIGQFM